VANGYPMSDTAEEIKHRLDIADFLRGYIDLAPAGKNFKARCPFHKEKTPSFFISSNRGLYYCFGCGAKGDIFNFVENFEGLDFRGALKVLADKAGVTLAEFKDNHRLISLLELATRFFEVNLNESARKYLAGRGLSEETIKAFRVGYAPDSFHGLTDYLKKKGFAEKEILEVGLLKKTDRGKIDHFRGRIMFPITDSAGRVIAFSGRIFPEKEKAPKYLNSPETILFKKGSILYGFDKAKFIIREAEHAILVEGQMDLILLHQTGFKNTVALSGTAISEIKGHLKELFYLSSNLILAFDSDSAGRKAALRAAEITLAYGFDVRIADLPAGLDPADVAARGDFKKHVAEAEPVILFLTNLILKEENDPRQTGKRIKAEVLPFVIRLPSSIEASHFVKKVSDLTGIREESIWEDLKRLPRGKEEIKETKKVESGIRRRLLGLLYWQEAVKTPQIDVPLLKEELKRLGILEENAGEARAYFRSGSFLRSSRND